MLSKLDIMFYDAMCDHESIALIKLHNPWLNYVHSNLMHTLRENNNKIHE